MPKNSFESFASFAGTGHLRRSVSQLKRHAPFQ